MRYVTLSSPTLNSEHNAADLSVSASSFVFLSVEIVMVLFVLSGSRGFCVLFGFILFSVLVHACYFSWCYLCVLYSGIVTTMYIVLNYPSMCLVI